VAPVLILAVFAIQAFMGQMEVFVPSALPIAIVRGGIPLLYALPMLYLLFKVLMLLPVTVIEDIKVLVMLLVLHVQQVHGVGLEF
jgi:hypothetical protein